MEEEEDEEQPLFTLVFTREKPPFEEEALQSVQLCHWGLAHLHKPSGAQEERGDGGRQEGEGWGGDEGFDRPTRQDGCV